MAITYNNLYLDIRRELRQVSPETATFDAQEIICFASGKSREELLRDGGLYMPQDIEEQTRTLLARHLDGEPVAYLIGEWGFYGLPLDITSDVLIPRPDTEVLVEQAIPFCREKETPRILDLCAGSGCVGLALASQVNDARVILGDLSQGALRICRQNTRRNDLTDRVSTLLVNAMEPPSPSLGQFDLIVSNPPYIPTADVETLDASVKDFEPRMALDGGDDGLDFYRYIIQTWKSALRPGGGLFFEVGIGQADDVCQILQQEGFGDLTITPDLGGIPRVVQGALLAAPMKNDDEQ